MQELVSIIVPVYNVEQYVQKCIESLLNQTYMNIEIIIIDDGTPDNSGKICDILAANQSRIQVIHKENEGVSIARNIGIEKAKGKYMCFVDSDDYVEADYIETLVNGIRESNAQLAVCGYKRECGQGRNRSSFRYIEKVLRQEKDEFYRKLSVDLEACFPWNKLFLTNIIKDNNIRFPVSIHPGEDLVFCISYIKYVENAIFLNSDSYIYVDSMNSVMKRIEGKSKFDNYYLQLQEMKNLLRGAGNQQYYTCCAVRVYEICCCLIYDVNKYGLKNDVSSIYNYINSTKEIFDKATFVPWRIKYRYRLMLKSTFQFDIVQHLYKIVKDLKQ